MKKSICSVAVLGLLTALSANGQTIDRVKMTDNELTCQQIYQETVQMDTVIANNKAAAAAGPASATGGVTAGQVASVATQTEGVANIAQGAATLSAYGGGFGGFGAAVGLSSLGSLFGGVAKVAQGSAAQQAATEAAAAQKAAAVQQGQALMAQQAQARKEHVTALFLSKDCKMSEIQK